jgi:hypothetical protein
MKVALVEPPGTVTLPGTCATEVLLLCNVTTMPPTGALPFKVTVPVEGFPPTTDVGLLEIEENVGALTVSVVVLVKPYVPEIVTEVFAATGLVVIVKVADVAPAATVTLGGTCATAVLVLCSVTVVPPVGAAALKVTVPVELAPPTTDVGVLPMEDKVTFAAAALMLRVALLLTRPCAGLKPNENPIHGLLLEAVAVAVCAPGVVMLFHSTRSTASCPLALVQPLPAVHGSPGHGMEKEPNIISFANAGVPEVTVMDVPVPVLVAIVAGSKGLI